MKTFDDTNRSGNPQPSIPDDNLKDLSPMEEAEMYNNGPEAPAERLSNNAVKGTAWLLGIVGVFAVAVLIAWFVGRHDSPLSSRSDARMAAALSEPQMPLNPTLASQSAQTPVQFIAILVPAGSQSAAAPALKSQKPGKVVKRSTTASAKTLTSIDEDRIEREAREVINGEFGNNPERKVKLGADYAAVQERVNEILQI